MFCETARRTAGSAQAETEVASAKAERPLPRIEGPAVPVQQRRQLLAGDRRVGRRAVGETERGHPLPTEAQYDAPVSAPPSMRDGTVSLIPRYIVTSGEKCVSSVP